MSKYLDRNKLSNIIPVNIFISSNKGDKYVPDRDTTSAINSGGNTWKRIENTEEDQRGKESITLKEVLDEYLNVDLLSIIKSDIQGFDLEVLLSNEEIISQYRPIIELEVYHKTDIDLLINFESFLLKNKYLFFVNLASNNTDIYEFIPFEIKSIVDFNVGKMFDVFCIPSELEVCSR